MENSTVWKLIDKYFTDNPQALVRHHIESYNDFFKNGIFKIFKEKNPIQILARRDDKIDDYRSKCIMYLGGKDGSKIYFGKPVIYDENNTHFMFPNEARLRNMTYGMTVHYDIDIEFIDILEEGEVPKTIVPEKIREDPEFEGGETAEYSSDGDSDNDDFRLLRKKRENQKKKKFMALTDSDVKEIEGGGKLTEERIQENRQQIRQQKEKELLEGGAPADKPKKRRTNKSGLTTHDNVVIREATEKSISGNIQKTTMTLEKIYLGKFPVMVQSDFCVLSGLTREIRHTMGECMNDVGGYFIIDGKEKTVVTQEKFADNMLYIRDVNDEEVLYSAEIKSVSENVAKPIRTLSVKILTPTKSYTNKNIVVNIPNVRKPVPLFIVFRALGILTDKQIITMCLLDLNKYESIMDLFIPSVHDAGAIMTQHAALNYIALLTKGKTLANALEILSDYFLPHIGETNFLNKAYYLGHIVFKLLSVYTGLEQPTDRDNFKYKRLELVGTLMYDLFREYYTIQQRQISLAFESILHFNKSIYERHLDVLVKQTYKEIFSNRIVNDGFKKAFKGNWGSQTHTKRIGVVQDLNRLSHNSMLSHLRKTNLPLDSSVKLVGPRVLNSSQWGYFDPIDTPDGANIGIHKHLSISTYISQGISREPFINWLREKIDMRLLEDCTPAILSNMTKIILNGLWAGSISTDPFEAVEEIKLYRRNALIPIYVSVTFDIKQQTIFIYTDGGRLCRPIFYRDNKTNKLSYENKDILKRVEEDNFTWNELISGFNKKKIENFKPNDYKMYELNELYEGIASETSPHKSERFEKYKAIIDYIDCSESEDLLIALNGEYLEKDHTNKFTHLEIHESFIFGMMCNMIIFPENNPATRNSFSCGQSKQACSMYHTNHQVRMDKTAVVLNNGQVPLVKSRYLEYINNEENTYGENAIVAIMCYTGYNVEDAILINEGALKRGLFRTTYYSCYESHEEKTKAGPVVVEKLFTNIEKDATVVGKKDGHDYSKLDKYGLVKEGTMVDDKTIIIGLAASSSENQTKKVDLSKTTKKGQLGIVDKTFITESEEGKRIAKVRIREERIPNIGDKMASRAGQKGTIGLVIPEEDMPFTKDGIRPDLIVNPHAIPSRMTIGHLVECIIGKASAYYGGFSDCTAFNNKGSKIGVFGELLPKIGYHSSGNEVLYNGMTGEQIEAEIFIGPNYYMRLKHMVKDKINYRALGPRTAMTKQPVSGRANDGGLRIGEMERDSVISHGATEFLRESMMERGDSYYMAVCNKTGLLAVYNPSKNIFMSPMADGPIKFIGSMDNKDLHIDNITKYGRSFSVVNIPYSLKLLIQELQTMNIQMRIITEENIDQLENLTYSKNMDKLMYTTNIEPQKIINEIKKNLTDRVKHLKTPDGAYTPESKPYDPNTPEKKGDDSDDRMLAVFDEFLDNKTSVKLDPSIYPSWDDGSSVDNSPEYKKISPENTTMSPPYPSPEKEDASKETSETSALSQNYNKGEIVYFRGDNLVGRIWKVRNIGDRFITIETENLQGIEDKDSIKVVTDMDIYRPEDFAYSERNAEPITGANQMMNGGGYSSKPNINTIGGSTPAINFNPVIRINNGGYDLSTDSQPNNTNEMSGGAIENNVLDGGKLNTITDLATMSTNMPSIKVKADNSQSGGEAPKEEKIDFSKLIIKKV